MTTSTLLIIAGGFAGFVALIAAGFMAARRATKHAASSCDCSSCDVPAQPAKKADDDASKWLAGRKEKLSGKLAELKPLVQQLTTAGLWRPVDEARLQRVHAELQDYLSSMEADARQNLHAYQQLFHAGPYTTVPFAPGGWSISWGVWMVDAHLELLIRHASARLRVLSLEGEKKEREELFVAEIESKIAAAGFDTGNPYVPRYRIENLARQASRCRLVRFEVTPFGLTLDEALDRVQVADTLPDVTDFAEKMLYKKPEEAVRIFQDYRTAVDRSWRLLTAEEKTTVRQALTQS